MSSIRLPSVLDDWTFTRGHLSCTPHWNAVMDGYSGCTYSRRRWFQQHAFEFFWKYFFYPSTSCSISSSIIVAMPRLDLIRANFSRWIFLCEGSIEKHRRLDVRGLRVEIMFERREREGGTSVSPHSHGSAVCFQPTIYALARALIELCNYGVARL